MHMNVSSFRHNLEIVLGLLLLLVPGGGTWMLQCANEAFVLFTI